MRYHIILLICMFCSTSLFAQNIQEIQTTKLTNYQLQKINSNPKLKKLFDVNPQTRRASASQGYKLSKVIYGTSTFFLLTDDEMPQIQAMERNPHLGETPNGDIIVYICMCGAVTDDCKYKEVKGTLKCVGSCNCKNYDVIVPAEDKNDPTDPEGSDGETINGSGN